jgi:hypothetical protein
MERMEVAKPLGQREVVIINVGANKSHPGLVSPVYEDGTFFFMPIPEEGATPSPSKDLFPGCTSLQTYREFIERSTHGRCVPIAERYLALRVHDDPEFVTFTYGDNPDTIARAKAANLKRYLREGDLLFFFAGLTTVRNCGPTDDYRFCFIGFYEVSDVLRKVTKMPTDDQLTIFGQNAHIKRGQANARFFNGFWVWKGSKNSQLFRMAVPFDRELGVRILRNRKGTQYDWPTDRTDVQLLGTRARASRRIMTEQSKRVLLRQVINTGNDVPLFERLLGLG